MKGKFYSRLLSITVIMVVLAIFVGYFEAMGIFKRTKGLSKLTNSNNILSFSVSNDLIIDTNTYNLTKNDGNIKDESNVEVSLLPNPNTKYAKYKYSLYLTVEDNKFIYSTSDKIPEIVLKITNSKGEVIKTIDGLKGNEEFDITEFNGTIKIVSDYVIEANELENKDEWHVEISLVNLKTNQNVNKNKVFIAKIHGIKEEIIEDENVFEINDILVKAIDKNTINISPVINKEISNDAKYYYCIDNCESDENWVLKDNNYTIGNLDKNSYNISIRVDNNGIVKEFTKKVDMNIYHVKLVCKQCIEDYVVKYVFAGEDIEFKFLPKDGYSIKNAEIHGEECTMDNDKVIRKNNMKDTFCLVIIK